MLKFQIIEHYLLNSKSQNPLKRMKIFISRINTQLGYHLTETLRQDHALLQGYSLISGTLTQSDSYILHDSIHQTYQFCTQRDLTVKNAIQSDVLIFDIRNDPAPQIEFILKVLRHCNLKKSLKIIGISNFMTWSNSKTSEFSQIPYDKQALLQFSLNKQKWKSSTLKKQHYPIRVPHPMFVYNYLLQEQIMHLKHSQPFIQPIILCAGLIYGKSGFDLKEQLQYAVKCMDSPLLTLRNNKIFNEENVLPLVNVDILLQKIDSLIYQKEVEALNQRKQYEIVCQQKSKSIIKIIEMMNQLCGNMKQINNNSKQIIQKEKPIDKINLLMPQNSANLQTNEHSTRVMTPLPNLNRNSSQTNSLSLEPITTSFIPQLTFCKNKRNFSLMMNIQYLNKPIIDTVNEKHQNQRVKNEDDSYIDKSNQKQNDLGDSMVKVKVQKQSDEQIFKKGINTIVDQFLEYYEVEYKHFIISEQLLHELSQSHQINEKFKKSILDRYCLLNKEKCVQQIAYLIESGAIPHQKLTTPQQQKKKSKVTTPNIQNRESLKKQPYEICFSEIIKHILKKNQHTNYLICLKHDLIGKMLSLLHEHGFEDLKDSKFINITAKTLRPHTPSNSLYSNMINIQKSLQIQSDEFYSVFGIQNPHIEQADVNYEKIHFTENQMNLQIQKTKKVIEGQREKSSQQNSQMKINLMSQYLLDNLIIYLAQAKQQLKLKGKLNIGQTFEGKQNIKLFIQELKQIKKRQLILAREEQQYEETLNIS